MRKLALKSKIILEYLDKFPNTFSRTLARIIYRDTKPLFDNEDQARTYIRMYRGALGDGHRQRVKNKKHFQPINEFFINQFNLPESDADDFPPYQIDSKIDRLLIMADMHIPYHDIEAITLVLNEGKKMGCNGILLDGDILDCVQLSRFVHDPRERKFKEEVKMGIKFLAILRKEFNCPIYYKLGNHEERYQKYMFIKAAELIGIEEYNIENILHFSDNNIKLIENQQIVMAGKLPIVHGHEFWPKISTSSANTARGLFLRSSHTAICAHFHRTSENDTNDMMGKLITTWSIGCLCALHPEYARINLWNHGFAVVDIFKDGSFMVHNRRIYKGKIL